MDSLEEKEDWADKTLSCPFAVPLPPRDASMH